MKKMMLIVCAVSLLIILGMTTKNKGPRVIKSPDAPAAIGPYSQAVLVNDTLYLSGQLGIDPETGKLKAGFTAQARQALKNQQAVLKAAGFELKNVVQCQVFVKDLNNYGKFNQIYKEFFRKDFPARAVLQVSRIPADGLIEIMMTAVK